MKDEVGPIYLKLTLIETVFYYGQPTGPREGKTPHRTTGFWPPKFIEPPALCEFWLNRFQWGMVAKHRKQSKSCHFDGALMATQIGAWDRKNYSKAIKTNNQSLYLPGGERPGRVAKKQPRLNLGATRYPRVLEALEAEFKKERNETYEIFGLLPKKHHINGSLEQFHSVLSGLAARCNS